MPIKTNKDGLVEVSTKAGEMVWVLPPQLFTDLRFVAVEDGIEKAGDDKWLLYEVRLNGEPKPLATCWNCGDTGGFLSPVGDKDRGIFRYRPDGVKSPFSRRLQYYPCPTCQNPTGLLKSRMKAAGIPDPTAALARDIWWDMPKRERMGQAVREFAERIERGEVGGMLTLVGSFGIGKSILGEWLVTEALKVSRPAMFVTADDFKRAVSESIEGSEQAVAMLEHMRTVPVLVFDQIDWVRESNANGQPSYSGDQFRDLFNFRYNLRRTHATVFTANLDAWNARGGQTLGAIYSRMEEGEVVVVEVAGVRSRLAQMEGGE